MQKAILRVLNVLVLIILFIIIFVNSVILISSFVNPDEVPSFFGWKPFITLSGSMESEIYAGDLAIVKEVDTKELKKGDVIAFRQDDIVITHRIEEILIEDGTKKFITKGDNNYTTDILPVYESMIEGKYMFKVPKIGNVAIFIQTPTGMIVVLAIPILILLLLQVNKNRNNTKKLKDSTKNEKELKEEIEKLKEENKKLSQKM